MHSHVLFMRVLAIKIINQDIPCNFEHGEVIMGPVPWHEFTQDEIKQLVIVTATF